MTKFLKWLMLLCLTGLMISTVTGAEEYLKIGILAPMETPVGKGIYQGAEMASEEINAIGGILGKPIQLVFADDKFKGEIGAFEYMKLVQEEKVVAVIGTASTEVALAVMEQMAKYKTPFLSTGAAGPKIVDQIEQYYDRYKYAFRLCFGSDELANITSLWILHLIKSRNMKKIAMIIESAAWTKPIAETWEKQIKETGTEIPVMEYFYKGATDFTPVLNKIINNNVEMICFVSAHIGAAPFISAWANMKGPILTGIIAGSYATLWNATEGKVMSITVADGTGAMGLTDKDKRFFEKYKKKYNVLPEYATPYSYDAIYILKAAIENAKSTEPDPLIEALEKTDMEGVIGKWAFQKSHSSKHQLIIAQWQKDGNRCIVWPENIKTCDFILPPWY